MQPCMSDVVVDPAPLVKIRVEYPGGTIDEYEIEEGVKHRLLDHFWDNPNVKSVAFIRCSETSTNQPQEVKSE